MDSLRIDTGEKKLLINDGPEFIVFNPADQTFAERFYSLIGEFEAKMIEYQARSVEIDENKELDAHDIPVNLQARMALIRDACVFIRERIDYVFGAGTSQKTFGDVLNLDMFTSFFTQITPFIRASRTAKVAPYMNQVTDKRKKHAVMK